MIIFSGVGILGKMAVPSTRESNAPRATPSTKSSRPRDLYEELKPLWLTLLLVMAAPIQRSKSGVMISRWDSWSGALTLVIFVFNWFVVYHAFPVQIKALRESESFPEQVFASIFIVTLNVYVLIPLTAWPFANRLAMYINDWADFQANYAEVASRQFELQLWDQARLAALCCLLTLPHTIIQFVTISNAPAWHSAAYVPVAVHSMAVVGAWHCNCAALGNAASRMSEDFVLTVSSGSLAVHIRRYRKLWANLQKLSVSLSKAQSAVLLHVVLCLAFMNLISAFGVLGAIVAGVAVSRVFVMLAMAATTHLELLIVCSAGYRVADKINMEMRSQLLSLPKPRSPIEEHEVMLFLKEVAIRPAALRIIGYMDVDRLMYVKVVAAVARNFLVLLQFAYTGSKAAVRPTEAASPRDDFYDFLR